MAERKTLEEAQVLAASAGGLCISKEYKNNHTKMTWKCKMGHVWQTTLSHVVAGSWCHICNGGKY